MNEAMLAIFKDEIEQRVSLGRNEGKLIAYEEMIRKGRISVEEAAEEMNMTVTEFKAAVENLKVIA